MRSCRSFVVIIAYLTLNALGVAEANKKQRSKLSFFKLKRSVKQVGPCKVWRISGKVKIPRCKMHPTTHFTFSKIQCHKVQLGSILVHKRKSWKCLAKISRVYRLRYWSKKRVSIEQIYRTEQKKEIQIVRRRNDRDDSTTEDTGRYELEKDKAVAFGTYLLHTGKQLSLRQVFPRGYRTLIAQTEKAIRRLTPKDVDDKEHNYIRYKMDSSELSTNFLLYGKKGQAVLFGYIEEHEGDSHFGIYRGKDYKSVLMAPSSGLSSLVQGLTDKNKTIQKQALWSLSFLDTKAWPAASGLARICRTGAHKIRKQSCTLLKTLVLSKFRPWIKRWRKAQEATAKQNHARGLQPFYHSKFYEVNKKRNRRSYLAHKSKIGKWMKFIKIRLEKLSGNWHPQRIHIQALQFYRTPMYHDVGLKKLTLKKEQGKWKVFRESWQSSIPAFVAAWKQSWKGAKLQSESLTPRKSKKGSTSLSFVYAGKALHSVICRSGKGVKTRSDTFHLRRPKENKLGHLEYLHLWFEVRLKRGQRTRSYFFSDSDSEDQDLIAGTLSQKKEDALNRMFDRYTKIWKKRSTLKKKGLPASFRCR